MATAYQAKDLKHHREVARKVLRRALAAALGPERFLREIEIAARSRHPHILPLYRSGSTGDALYYVMPLVEGESLRDRLNREKQLSIADAVKMARAVPGAVAAALSRALAKTPADRFSPVGQSAETLGTVADTPAVGVAVAPRRR